jgi:hypothetical protein
MSSRPTSLLTVLVLASAVVLSVGLAVAAAPAAALTFGPSIDYSAGYIPGSVAVGDFNGDGIKDLVTGDRSDGTVSVFLGVGDGSYEARTAFSVGAVPSQVAVSDVDGDGHQDVVTANENTSTVAVLLGDGSGALGSAVQYATGSVPVYVAVGDFDHDGAKDLVTANCQGDNVSILLGSGDGTFPTHANYGAGDYPRSVAVADFDKDGVQDLVAGNQFAGSVSVLLGNGDGTFAARTPYSAPGPWGVATGDLDGDGAPDVVVGSTSAGTVGVLLGKGDGTFGAVADFATGAEPTSVAVADVDGDGKQDVVSADYSSNTASVLLGVGGGGLGAPRPQAVGVNPQGLAVADLDRDGRRDLVTANYIGCTVSVLLQIDPTPSFAAKTDFTVGSVPFSVAVGDFNRDGKRDLTIANSGADTLSVLLGGGDGTFAANIDYGVGFTPASVAVGDFNGDGTQDLASANWTSNTATAYLGNGDGTFTVKTDSTTGQRPRSIAVGDLDGDGNQDLVTANSLDGVGGNSVSVLLGHGDGTFAGKADYPTGMAPMSVAVGDFDDDGTKDLVTADSSANTATVLLGKGDGTFGTGSDYPTGTTPGSVAVGDFNRDGKQDLVAANVGDSTVSVLLGGGGGGFGAKTDFVTGTSPFSVALGDVNRDGKQDLAVANAGDATVSVLLGKGDGTFADKTDFATGAMPVSVTVGDFNRDGWPDLATADRGSNKVSILLNNRAFAPAGNLVVNNGAAWTSSRWVTVNSNVNLAMQMRFRELNGVWNGWQLYANMSNFWLPGGDGLHTVQGQYVNLGGLNVLLQDDISLDTTAPTTTAVDVPTGWVTSPPAVVTLSPDDGAGSGMVGGAAKTEYEIDDDGWSTGTSVSVSGDGTHTVQYHSTDMVGNTEATKNFTVKIDGTAPVSTMHGVDANWHAWPVTVFVTASDSGSGMTGGAAKIEYNLDGAGWVEGDLIVVIPDGDHTLQVRATDAAGKTETPTTTYHVRVDRTAPTTTDNAASPWVNSQVTVHLTAADAGSGMTSGSAEIEYSTDGGTTWIPALATAATNVVVDPDPVTHSTDGLQLLYRSTDAVGNVEATKSCTVPIDTRGPTTSGNKVSVRKGKKATFKVKATDPTPGSPSTSADPTKPVKIRIKNSRGKLVKTLTAPAPVATNVTVTLDWARCRLAKGTYKYKVYACDQAGNPQVKAGGNKLIVR